MSIDYVVISVRPSGQLAYHPGSATSLTLLFLKQYDRISAVSMKLCMLVVITGV